jgi:hypothetical protein
MTETRSTDVEAAAAKASLGWRLERGTAGSIVLVDGAGRRHDGVDARRAFPVSRPLGPVALSGPDGRELAWIDSLADQPPDIRRLVEEALAARETVEIIVSIRTIGDGRPAEWNVETMRGPRRFRVAHTADVLRRADGSLCVIDTTGVRHEIPDPSALDHRSRRLLERHA